MFAAFGKLLVVESFLTEYACPWLAMTDRGSIDMSQREEREREK